MLFALRGGKARAFLLISMAAMALLTAVPVLQAQSTMWDSLVSDSHWYVPTENMLAYLSPTSSFANPLPIADQTLWSLGTCTNGVFTGDSAAILNIAGTPSSSTSTIQGVVTDDGQIRMIFTGASVTTTGIGQMREVDGITYMQMQMVTGQDGEGGGLVTHWAYMAEYDPATFTPPNPTPEVGLRSTEWSWLEGTSWDLQSDTLFGTGGTGTFNVTNYHNGYFWGSGTGPAGSPTETFTELCSVTPEGTLLFNILDDSILTSLAGQITGDSTNGTMVMRKYNDDATFGSAALGTIQPVPEPSTWMLIVLAGVVLAGLCHSKAFSYSKVRLIRASY